MSRAAGVENDRAAARETLAAHQPWHQVAVAEVFAALQSAPRGLSGEEVQHRRITFGPNELAATKRRTPLTMFLAQFTDFMIR